MRSIPSTFRLLIELGAKNNDDCWVAYANREYDYSEAPPSVAILRGKRVSNSGRLIVGHHLALCRPVYELEVRQGLVIDGGLTPLCDCGIPGTPDCTLWFDAIHTFARLMGQKIGVDQWMRKWDGNEAPSLTMSEIIGMVIDEQYSPAVSAGMPIHLMSVLKYVIEHLADIDMSVSCNMLQQNLAGEAPQTLADFYEEVRSAPDLCENLIGLTVVIDRLLLEGVSLR